jgi:hypothetical protein
MIGVSDAVDHALEFNSEMALVKVSMAKPKITSAVYCTHVIRITKVGRLIAIRTQQVKSHLGVWFRCSDNLNAAARVSRNALRSAYT